MIDRPSTVETVNSGNGSPALNLAMGGPLGRIILAEGGSQEAVIPFPPRICYSAFVDDDPRAQAGRDDWLRGDGPRRGVLAPGSHRLGPIHPDASSPPPRSRPRDARPSRGQA